jgi:hypothetical protein
LSQTGEGWKSKGGLSCHGRGLYPGTPQNKDGHPAQQDARQTRHGEV